ncbi:MAG TPA: hypothetical protein VKQ54_05190 [Caulobacteraceae bacterium]|nr:hypothetical protein [Caulobacteraceae bacterium]
MSPHDPDRASHLRQERDRVLRQIEILRSDSRHNYVPGMGPPDNRRLIVDLTIVAGELNRALVEMEEEE